MAEKKRDTKLDTDIAIGDSDHSCAVCGEISPERHCVSGRRVLHRLCGPCAKVCEMVKEKTENAICDRGQLTERAQCPIYACDGFIAEATAPAGGDSRPVPRAARTVKISNATSIVQTFLEGMPAVTEVSAFQLVNPSLSGIYNSCKANMQRRYAGRVATTFKLERKLWHGTDRDAAGGILREGFDIRRSGSVNGQAYGAGVYLTENIQTAHGYAKNAINGKYCMLYCDVLTGEVGKGKDSAQGGDASIFVVSREQQILPTHVIYYTFTPVKRGSGKLPVRTSKTGST